MVSKNYVSWLNDPSINQYLESRFVTSTLKSVKTFVKNQLICSDTEFFGIFLRDEGKHIGNIKLGEITSCHKRGNIGILIGEKSTWGNGYATEAIKIITN